MNAVPPTRVAVITGGAGDLGRACSTRLAADGVIGELWDLDERRAREVARSAGQGWIARAVDVTDPDSVRSAVTAALSRHGKIDVLVTSAGITGPSIPTADYDVATWRRVLAVNLDGVFHCAQACIEALVAAPAGRMVHISSVAGKEGNANLCAYSAAKAGVIALTKTLGKELAHTDVRVNCITPAMLNGALLQQMTPEYVEAGRAKIPVGRFGEPAEIAELVAFLASPACSFSTGAVFDASGGRATY